MMAARSAEASPLRPYARETREDALANQIALELADRGQDVEEKPAGGRRGVDGLVEYDKVHSERLQLLRDHDEVMG
jgi:hypothetical protein